MFRRRATTSERPTLSAVVPVYDVERFLPQCLASIAAQDFSDYELIVVDDGSPDDSVAIVERHARRDRRIRLLRQENAGLGAARNAGAALARGELLTFVDSDDELAPGAWSRMVGTLRSTGSDMVVGKAVRDDGIRRWPMRLMRANHEVERLSATLEELPGMLADVFAWNKVYRLDFWRGHEIAFPVGVRYEDQPTLTRVFLAAHRFDVLTETVYRWRVRADGTSITQRRHELEDLQDRVATKRDSAEQVHAHASATVRHTFHAQVLPVDMAAYFRAVPACGEEYWRLLVDSVHEFWNDETVPFERTLLPVQQRLMGWFVAEERRADLVDLIGFLDAHRGRLPVEDGRLLHPWHDEAGLPASLVEV